MQHFLFSVFALLIISINTYSQCASNLLPITLPFVDDFENYSDTLSNNDTLICTSTFNWTFNASNVNGRALCGTGSPVNNGGNGGVTFDVNAFGIFNQNDFVLTLNLSNYTSSSPIYLSFDCNNVADEPNVEDRIFIRGSKFDNWIEVYDWSVLPQNTWFRERESIQITDFIYNSGQSFSSSFQVKFSQYDNYGYSSDGFAIDNIEIAEVNCTKAQNPTINYQNLDTAILSWDAVSGVNWNLEYGLKGFNLGQGTTISTNNSSDTLTQLIPNSVYEVYIQKDCGMGELSSWTEPITIYTPITNDSSCNAILVPTNGNTIHTHNKNTGLQFAENFLLGNSPNNTIWFKTIVPNSGHLAIETCLSNFNTELGAYSITNCSDLTTFTSLGTSSFSSPSTQNVCNSPGKAALELCGLNPNDTIYFWIGSYTPTIEDEILFSVFDYSLNNSAGNTILDSLNICISDTLNLYTNIQNYNSDGNWSYSNNPNAIYQDSLLIPGNMTFNSNTVHFVTSNICDADSIDFNVYISEENHAGEAIENLEFCNSSTVFLFSTLSGLIETNGTWYTNSNTPLEDNFIYYSNSESGNQNYQYVVDNNSCPADTTSVNFTILDCTSILEPTNKAELYITVKDINTITIQSSLDGQINIYDYNGKLVIKNKNIHSYVEQNINISKLSKGLYLVELNNSKHRITNRFFIH